MKFTFLKDVAVNCLGTCAAISISATVYQVYHSWVNEDDLEIDPVAREQLNHWIYEQLKKTFLDGIRSQIFKVSFSLAIGSLLSTHLGRQLRPLGRWVPFLKAPHTPEEERLFIRLEDALRQRNFEIEKNHLIFNDSELSRAVTQLFSKKMESSSKQQPAPRVISQYYLRSHKS